MGWVELNFPRTIAVNVPGMHKNTGKWAECRGVLRPVILVDPAIEGQHGALGIVIHEAEHANGFHGLVSVLLVALGLVGASVGVAYEPWVGLAALFSPIFLVLWLRKAETLADLKVLRTQGPAGYRAMLYLVGVPSTRWGRWLYGATLEARYRRALRKDVR